MIEILILLLHCVIITFIITTIWDVSGFIFEVSKYIYEKMNPDKPYMGQQLMKPFGCSYCMTFHTLWIYLLINGVGLIYTFAIACVFTYIQTLMKKILININNKINKLEND